MNPKGNKIRGRFYWDDDRLVELRALLATNATITAIAKSFGVKDYTIVHAIKQYELICESRQRGPKIHLVPKAPSRPVQLPTLPGWPTKSQLMARR